MSVIEFVYTAQSHANEGLINKIMRTYSSRFEWDMMKRNTHTHSLILRSYQLESVKLYSQLFLIKSKSAQYRSKQCNVFQRLVFIQQQLKWARSFLHTTHTIIQCKLWAIELNSCGFSCCSYTAKKQKTKNKKLKHIIRFVRMRLKLYQSHQSHQKIN